jgi:hypothetical protein
VPMEDKPVNIKFWVKLGKGVTEKYNLIQQVCDDEALSRARVFEWHRRFCVGPEKTKDDTSGCTCTIPRTFRGLSTFCNKIVKLPSECFQRICTLARWPAKIFCLGLLTGKNWIPDLYRAVWLQNKNDDRSASCAELLETAKKDGPFCLPSSLYVKHGEPRAQTSEKNKLIAIS